MALPNVADVRPLIKFHGRNLINQALEGHFEINVSRTEVFFSLYVDRTSYARLHENLW